MSRPAEPPSPARRSERREAARQGRPERASSAVVCRSMRGIALAACVPLWLAAQATGGQRGTTSCPATLANRLASTGNATQLVTVVAARARSTQGALRLWRKASGCWRPAAGPWSAWRGERGVSTHKREGDRTTPAGAFGFLPTMYGVAASPGRPLSLPPGRLRRLVGR